jgi:hypothetical protein
MESAGRGQKTKKERRSYRETSDLEFLTYAKHARANVWRLG